MDWKPIEEAAQKLMINRREHRERERGFIYYHGQRVGKCAVELRKKLFPDEKQMDDVLRLAGMFHDIGKGISPHNQFGAVIFRQAVSGLAPEPMIDKCAGIIAAHCKRQAGPSPFNCETQLVQDADLLDHSGSYGVWLDAQYYCYYPGNILDAAKHHFNSIGKYLEDNIPLCNFELTKRILKDRIQWENTFFERAELEGNGLIIDPAVNE